MSSSTAEKQRQKTQVYNITLLRTCQHASYWRPCFIRLWHFRGAPSGGGKEKLKEAESGDAEDHTESLCISRKDLASAALSNDTADQCRSSAPIMAFARRLKPLFEINNFSPRFSEVTLQRRPPEKAPHAALLHRVCRFGETCSFH